MSTVLLLINVSVGTVGCTRPADPVLPPTDTAIVVTPPPPPPPPADTITYIKRLEEDYIQSNPTVTRRTRNYSFYYDSNKRVTSIGIKNFGPIWFDTATCRLFYSGNAAKPYMIIAPDLTTSPLGQPVNYDTTYFTYNSANQLLADSSAQPFYVQSAQTYIRKPLKRFYNYQASTKATIDWYGYLDGNGPWGLFRKDSLEYATNFDITRMVSHFNNYNFLFGNYAVTESFTYSNTVNPLSKLNISGTIFSLMYTSQNNEILGNSFHKAVWNSNILPYYFDFFSPKIPSLFYMGGFTPGGFLIAAQYDAFDIRITPWPQRSTYPAQISVGASTALEDRFVYRYFYY